VLWTSVSIGGSQLLHIYSKTNFVPLVGSPVKCYSNKHLILSFYSFNAAIGVKRLLWIFIEAASAVAMICAFHAAGRSAKVRFLEEKM
jgi:hypothetical protein